MKYIVTGGAGFIGSHLIDRLIEENHQVICIDDFSSGYISNMPVHVNVAIINKTVQQTEFETLSDVDGVFHLAAQASVPKSIDDFYNSSLNNLQSTLKVWDWAIKMKIPVVYASSSAVYGNLPLGDDAVSNFDILSPYAQDKLSMEHYANLAWKVYQVRSIGLRFFNVYGPRQEPTSNYSGVISIFIDRLNRNLPLKVNGGYQTRDFIYVYDVVKCLKSSMDILHKKDMCESFNVGTGKTVTIDNLLNTIAEIINVKPKIIKVELPFGDPEISSGTYKKIEQILKLKINNFQPLRIGLKETIEYTKRWKK